MNKTEKTRYCWLADRRFRVTAVVMPFIALAVIAFGTTSLLRDQNTPGRFLFAMSLAVGLFLLAYTFAVRSELYAFARFQREGISVRIPFMREYFLSYRLCKGVCLYAFARKWTREEGYTPTCWVMLTEEAHKARYAEGKPPAQNRPGLVKMPFANDVRKELYYRLPPDMQSQLERCEKKADRLI